MIGHSGSIKAVLNKSGVLQKQGAQIYKFMYTNSNNKQKVLRVQMLLILICALEETTQNSCFVLSLCEQISILKADPLFYTVIGFRTPKGPQDITVLN